ncbi:MAG: VWA domain-containing protein [Candidatus Riflebacteria bacterium]|nr:VWA domain-containing protein [Candidatus Riflebacteria bacterium]
MFTEPHWLLLLFPGLWAVFRLRMRSRKILLLRVVTVVLVVLALAGMQLRLPGREGMLIVIADRSLSMPSDADSRISETLSLLRRGMPENGRLGVLSFADEVRVDMPPGRGSFSGFSVGVNPEASNLHEAINRALSLVPGDLSARIIILSDGLWSGKDPTQAAFKAAARGVPVDYRLLSRDAANDLALSRFEVPGLLEPGETFMIGAEVYAPVEQAASIELICSGHLIASVTRQLHRGNNSLTFRHSAGEASVLKYQLRVTGSHGKDPVPENNLATAIAEVRGRMPLLVVSEDMKNPLVELLKSRAQRVEVISPADIHWSLELLAGYSAVIIENVSANRIGMHGMQVLSAWVRHLGGGLMLTGGRNSYGNGGYYQSILEPILPVSLELRSEHRKLALALVLVLDRSGSMAAPAQGDRTKMDLANIAAANTIDLLSPLDEFGLLAVDTLPHVITPLQSLSDKGAVRNKVLQVESMGGGIYVEEGLSKACEMLLQSKAKTRHIILFADAADSEQPGQYWVLLEKAGQAGITCSVIGLGRETDSDANLLKKIAAEGKGRIFFTNDPAELPRLFTQDTFVAARSTFLDEPTDIATTEAISAFIGKPLPFRSRLGAYNLCYARPGAQVALQTLDENKAPLAVGWQQGLGRVICYMGVIDSAIGQPFLSSAPAAEILSGLCLWTAVDERQSIENMPVTQNIQHGQWQAVLHLDPERDREIFRDNPQITVMRSFADREPVTEKLTMNWETADSLSASLQLRGNETIVAMVDAGGNRRLRLYPVCLPYSQEYRPQHLEAGAEALKEIAAVTGGTELIDLSQAWNSMPSTVQFRNISDWLLFLALLSLFLEIVERRTALLSILLGRLQRRQSENVPITKAAGEKNVWRPASEAKTTTPVEANSEPQTDVVQSKPGFAGALKQAKKQAGRRTGK